MSYGELGVPPSQPRSGQYVPQFRKYAGPLPEKKPTRRTKETEILNEDLLTAYGIKEHHQKEVPLEAGDVIIVAKPFVDVLATCCRGIRCEHCLRKTQKLVPCSACKAVSYCSDLCKESDTKNHGAECVYFERKGTPPTSDTTRFIFRFILRMKKDGENLADTVPGSEKKRYFKDLIDHYDDIIDSPRKATADMCYEEIIGLMGPEEAPDPDYFLECYGRMAINSFNILDQDHESVGIGLYLGPSIMNHSCKPTASVVFDGRNIVVRALEPMKSRDFSNVTISYIDLLDFTKHRQEHLLRHYYFLCQCPRCLDVEFERRMFSISCENCDSPVDVGYGFDINDLEPGSCEKCDLKPTEHTLFKYLEIMEVVVAQLAESAMAVNVAEFCLRHMKKARFHHYHIFYIKCLEVVFQEYVEKVQRANVHKDNTTLISSALEIGLQFLAAYTQYSQHICCHAGLVCLNVAELEDKLKLKLDAKTHLIMAENILRISQGQNTSIYRQRILPLMFKYFDN